MGETHRSGKKHEMPKARRRFNRVLCLGVKEVAQIYNHQAETLWKWCFLSPNWPATHGISRPKLLLEATVGR